MRGTAPVLVFCLLFFCSSSVTSQSVSDNAVIDYCGQSCPSSCEEAEAKDAVCRCDSECERYGDCCSPPSARLNCTGGEQRAQPLAGLQCRSIHLDSRTQPDLMEAFWMVSVCPEDWPAKQDDEILREVNEKCGHGSDTLPPVTDLDGGVVYKNEYCAVCHQVANIQPWRYRFGCSLCLWNMLETQNINLTREMVEQECIACGFHIPQTGPPPRHCLHDSLVVSECLTKKVLEERTGLRWEEEGYSDILTQCQTGPVRPVAANPCDEPPTYRNQYCAICNAEKTADLVCTNPYDSRNDLDFCLRDAQSCSNSYDYDFGREQDSNSDMSQSAIPPNSGSRGRRSVDSDPNHQTLRNRTENETEIQIIKNNIDDCLTLPVFITDSITLLLGNSGGLVSEGYSTAITASCSKGEVFDPIDQTCRQTICPAVYATNGGLCAIATCDEGLIVLRESEFELLDNDTLLFHNEAFEIVAYNDSSPIICSNFSQNGTIEQNMTVYSYPPVFSVLTYVGCSLSVVGCVVLLITYSLFKELRSLPGQILMNLASTILATCLFLMIGIPIVSLIEKDELCEAAAIFLHLLVLSQFSWMSIMNFELLRTLYRASRLHAVEDKSRKNKIFFLYFLIGWGIPLVFTLITVIVNYATDVIQYGRDGFCWIGHVPSFYVVFLAPVALSIVFNGITFIITFSLLFKASRAQAKLKKQQNTSYLRVSLSAFSITGLTWIFGFLAIVVRDDWAWYTYIILTSTQGLVIAIAFVFTQKVSGLYKKLLIHEFQPVTSSKSNTKQRTQKSSLETKPARKKENASIASTTPALAQCDAICTRMAVQSIRENDSGVDVSIEMSNV